MNENSTIRDSLIGSIVKVLSDEWCYLAPGEPEPHSIHFNREIQFTFEFWEEPSEAVKTLLANSKISYFVTRRVGKLVLKPLT
jgi:hypothetical protein